MKITLKLALASLFLALTSLAHAQSPNSVLVVANKNNASSVALADYYMSKRHIPAANKLLLNWNASDNADTCSMTEYDSLLAQPINTKVRALGSIDYIVICRNLPVQVRDNTNCVDSMLAGNSKSQKMNPYFGKTTPFSAKQFGCTLVTRLDGWSWADAYALVDRSMYARPVNGAPVLMDQDPSKTGSYSFYNRYMSTATTTLAQNAVTTLLDTTPAFINPGVYLAGYISWGSNDSGYSAPAYNSLSFAPGAIAETLVSTSASNLRYPGGWQSQIAVLINRGVTGVKGYVAEPYVSATARPQYLFTNYMAGRNLAEAFYSASPYLGWKDVIVGDPLCAPYRPTMTVSVSTGLTQTSNGSLTLGD